MIARILVVILAALGTAGCHPSTAPVTPDLQAARDAEKAAGAALTACVATTALWDKVQGQGTIQVTLDEIKTCGPDVLALVTAAVKLHQAEQVALAVVTPKGDATIVTVTKAPGTP